MEGSLVVTLSSMDRSGAAVGRDGAERLLVHGGIPGERVRVRRGRAVGHGTLCELVEVVEPSPHRVVPRCRHAAVCGGCSWQHVSYHEQLRIKTRALDSLLQRELGALAPPVRHMIGTPVAEDGMPWGFRQKAAFVFAPGPDGLAMGHFARGTHDVVPVVECPVHPERANRIAFALRDELRRGGVAAAGDALAGVARHVLVRASQDAREAVALLVVTRRAPELEAPLAALLACPERPDGLALNLHDRPGPYLVGRETQRVAGNGHVREEALGPAFLVAPTSFFQTNVAAASVLVRLVHEALSAESGQRVLDLYSGAGLFALPLALRGHTVTAVEESRKSVSDAELNRRTNRVAAERLKLVASSVERALPHLKPGAFDAVVLDPPRDGASPAVLREVFGRLRPRRAVLVSCNPDALARELKHALGAGYRVVRVQPVDMFPHTPHVEAVAVLERLGDRPSAARERGARPPRPSSRSRTPGSRKPPARGRTPTP